MLLCTDSVRGGYPALAVRVFRHVGYRNAAANRDADNVQKDIFLFKRYSSRGDALHGESSGEHVMTTMLDTDESSDAIALSDAPAAPSPEVLQHVLLGGDLSKLTPRDGSAITGRSVGRSSSTR